KSKAAAIRTVVRRPRPMRLIIYVSSYCRLAEWRSAAARSTVSLGEDQPDHLHARHVPTDIAGPPQSKIQQNTARLWVLWNALIWGASRQWPCTPESHNFIPSWVALKPIDA